MSLLNPLKRSFVEFWLQLWMPICISVIFVQICNYETVGLSDSERDSQHCIRKAELHQYCEVHGILTWMRSVHSQMAMSKYVCTGGVKTLRIARIYILYSLYLFNPCVQFMRRVWYGMCGGINDAAIISLCSDFFLTYSANLIKKNTQKKNSGTKIVDTLLSVLSVAWCTDIDFKVLVPLKAELPLTGVILCHTTRSENCVSCNGLSAFIYSTFLNEYKCGSSEMLLLFLRK